MPGMEPRVAACKISTLPTVLSLWPQDLEIARKSEELQHRPLYLWVWVREITSSAPIDRGTESQLSYWHNDTKWAAWQGREEEGKEAQIGIFFLGPKQFRVRGWGEACDPSKVEEGVGYWGHTLTWNASAWTFKINFKACIYVYISIYASIYITTTP